MFTLNVKYFIIIIVGWVFMRRLILFGFIFFPCSILTGCWNPKEKNTPQLPDTKEETASENEIFLSKEVKEGVDDSSIC